MEDPRSGLTRRTTGSFASADLRSDRDTLSPMDAHAAVRMLTAGRNLLQQFDAHTLLRLPTGIFYAPRSEGERLAL